MIADLVIAAVHDACAVLRRDGFASALPGTRSAIIADALGKEYPRALASYLERADAEGFYADIAGAYAYARRRRATRGNGLLDALADHLTGEFAEALDQLDAGFFRKDPMTKEGTLAGGPFRGPSAVHAAVRTALSRGTYHAIAAAVRGFLADVGGSDEVTVRTAREAEPELKRKVRASVRKDRPRGFPVFLVDRRLGGGIRLYAGGNMTDASWLADIDRVFSAAERGSR